MKTYAELLEQYRDKFTLDNRINPQVGVTESSVSRAREMLSAARRSRVEEARVAELFTTSDIGFSVAHLSSAIAIPQLEEELKSLDGLAGQRTVKDLNPVVLRGVIGSAGFEGAGVDQYGAAAVIPEGTPFPIVEARSTEEAHFSSIVKRGVQFNVTVEALINDLLGELDRIPEEFQQIVFDSKYADILGALLQADQYLEAVTLPDGTTTLPNAPLSAQGLIAAAVALENREINGRKIGRVGTVNVVVPMGAARFLEYDLAQFGRVIAVQDGALTLSPDREIQALLPSLNIIESDRVTGTEWFMYPRPGTTRRPVLERLNLRGFESPEIRFRSDSGQILGGNVAGFRAGSFDADVSSLRLRFFGGAVLWDSVWVVRSKGTGTA
ncbi:hypothetical protein [Microbacterium sp. zg-YB36]|uniref:phage major capsid protein n=1 Tax=Microbacterium sp. zg-YB36 TaxID=2969407 RepID=UPI00214C6FFD|nr:hypothetical protein [Microbacterium sp. zg-YB36]MDL5351210.1 hypothetical protein [Microbacterium sp. zg-YB36]